MNPSAVLLIDLENFYYSREDNIPGYDRHWFASDLEKLLGFAREMVEPLPFTVRRAYANFGVVRYQKGASREFPLQAIPDALMRQGVEPVQVFRLSSGNGGRGSKNAADMRMAMDATALLASAAHVEHFVLVTGDADFIPVILELKRQGQSVSVIGVANATNELIQRFVDNFELYEDLVAAEEVESRSGEVAIAGDGMIEVAAAVRRLLNRTHPLRFAAVKPLLSKELGRPFDPGMFGCDTTGDFLRKYQSQLGVEIRVLPHDQELDVPNGTSGAKPTARVVFRSPEGQSEPHSRAHYQQLLGGGGPADSAVGSVKVPTVPWSVLAWACDAAVVALSPPTGGPATSQQLLPRLLQATDSAAIPDLDRYLRRLYPILRAALPVTDGLLTLTAECATAEQIRREVLRFITQVLFCRLTENGVSGAINPEALASAFEPGLAINQAKAELAALVAEMRASPAVPQLPSTPTTEEIHTPAAYLRLLKAGGPKGSENESLKILPVPWSSVERLCADVFAALSPAAGGALMPRDQLQARLAEAGKELAIDNYEQHVPRALRVLHVAGELVEDDGLLSLNADVTSAHDLRSRALAFLLDLLRYRLEERGITEPIRPVAFVAALEAGSFTDQLMEEVVPAIAWMYRPEPPEPRLLDPAIQSLPTEDPFTDPTVPSARGDDQEPYSLDEAVEGSSAELTEPGREQTVGDTATEPAGDESALDQLADATTPQSDSYGELDMDVITREAVASVNEEPPIHTPILPATPGVQEVTAKGLEELPRQERHAPKTEQFPLAVPVADWLPDAEWPSRAPGSTDGHLNQPQAHVTPAVDKIPTPAQLPPPLPPLPPESA